MFFALSMLHEGSDNNIGSFRTSAFCPTGFLEDGSTVRFWGISTANACWVSVHKMLRTGSSRLVLVSTLGGRSGATPPAVDPVFTSVKGHPVLLHTRNLCLLLCSFPLLSLASFRFWRGRDDKIHFRDLRDTSGATGGIEWRLLFSLSALRFRHAFII